MRTYFSMKRKNRKPKALVVLTSDELEALQRRKRILAEANATASMLRHGYAVFWQSLQQKYELPDDIDFSDETGEIFAKEKAG